MSSLHSSFLIITLLCLSSPAVSQESTARQNSNVNVRALGESSRQPAERKLRQGVDISELKQNKADFTVQNQDNMDILSCNKLGETFPHTANDLEKDYEMKVEQSDSGGCDIDIHYIYKGNPPISGILKNLLGCYYNCCIWLVADEIEYRFPVETRETSNQIFDSKLRLKPQYVGSYIPARPPGGTGGDDKPGSARPGGGTTQPPFVGDGSDAKVIDNGCGSFSFNSDADIDTDGRGQRIPGQTELPETSFKWGNGQSLNSDNINFVVLPTNSKEFGNCRDHLGKCVAVTYGGVTKYGIVGDCGPNGKTGEMSTSMAQEINDDPNLTAKKPDANGNGKVDHYEGFGSGGQVNYQILNSKVDKSKQLDNNQIKNACEQEKRKQDECAGKTGGTTGGATAGNTTGDTSAANPAAGT